MVKSPIRSNKSRIKSEIKTEATDIKNILKRLKNRDFSGNAGLAVKNSAYQLFTNLVSKFGALIFTIILARLLMPELFGLYSLALGTILLFSTISNLGSNQALIRFLSKSLTKKQQKAKAYTLYFFKLRIILVFISLVALASLSKFMANNFYNKPIFFALLAGTLYILFINFFGILDSIFMSQNNFKQVFYKETLFQISRIIIIPLVIILTLSLGEEILTMSIILALAFCLSLSAFISIMISRKSLLYLKEDSKNLTKKQKKSFNIFISALAITALSGMFFSYIDTLFLGVFTTSEMIGFYKAAITLIGAAVPLITFATAFFPIFSKLKGKQAKKALGKLLSISIPISILALIFSFIIAPYLISFVYGEAYSNAVLIFRIFTILLVVDPLIAIYSTFHISQNKPLKVTKAIIYSTAINIILNSVFIIYLLKIRAPQYSIVLGITLATLISRFLYLSFLGIKIRK